MKTYLAQPKQFTQKFLLLVLCFCCFKVAAQTLPKQPNIPAGLQRIKFSAIKSSVNTGQDYSNWFNDDLTKLVPNDWDNNFVWTNITLKLTQHSIIKSFDFYDYEGVFTDAPATIYVINNGKITQVGTFTGPNYMVFDRLVLKTPIEADAVVIRKYSNNIPQKVFIYGTPDPNRLPVAAPVADASLNRLAITTGRLYPTFVSSTTDYTSTVSGSVASVVVIPQVNYAGATITVNGIAAPSTQRTKDIPLVTGNNVIKTVVTAADGKTTKTYTITINKSFSTDATLANLSVNGSILSPAFSPATTTYSAIMGSAVTSTIITPTAHYAKSSIKVNGATVLSGSSSTTIPFFTNSLTNKIIVTAEDGKTTKTYTINVVKSSPSDASLLKLALNTGTLSPNFNTAINSYKVSVNNATSSVIVTPTASDASASIAVNGKAVSSGGTSPNLSLAVGNNTIQTTVKSKNGFSTKLYTLTINRADVPVGVIPPINPPPVVTPPVVTPPVVPVIPPILTGTDPIPDTGGIVKIPIDSTRWYMLNNVSNGLGGLFNGNLTDVVNTGYGFIFKNYDAFYPVKPGERIDLYGLRFYADLGTNLGAYPLTVSVIDSTGTRTVVGTYVGGIYKAWQGPTVGSTSYSMAKAMKNVKYIVLNCWYQFPNEMEFYGYYKAPTPIPALVKKAYPLNQYFGVNAFEWDIEDPTNPGVISTPLLNAMKSFTQVRHYMDWNKLESTQGLYNYNPIHSGGWNYDAFYQTCQANNMVVLADLKCMPDWMKAGWPADQQDAENVPVPYGSDYADPNSYILQAKVAFQYASRYGSNAKVASSLLVVDPSIRWTGDYPNTIKIGMNVIQYIECDNERDKWWKGRKAYQTAFEYAANMSAFYDGNKNTMGAGVGVKNADPNMKVVMGGLASADPEYVHAMIEWCAKNRGYNADGTVNLCWDIINYHLYSNNSFPEGYITIGVAPELSHTAKIARSFVEMSHEYANDMPVWVTESGYDLNQGSSQRAPAIGSKSPELVEADWILRTSLLYAREGIQRLFFYEEYDDNFANPTQYASSGLINADKTRKAAADYMYQVNKILGKFTYVKTTGTGDPVVDNYQLGDQQAYAVFVPDQTGRTEGYSLDLGGADSAYVFTPVAKANDMSYVKVKLTNGKLDMTVTETPQFVLPVGTSTGTNLAKQLTLQTPVNTFNASINLYPNPAAKYLTVALNNKNLADVTIKVLDVNMGKVYGTYSAGKGSENFSHTIDVSALPKGVFIVQVMQGKDATMRKVIKTN